ncbi:murein L,D-transpeptidase catalytic domain family protein [Parasphingopyxis sp. GrpM-11]|uniref:Murein L,D-transpeptidase catalytic domain family protein n=2 Tax=Parasphingopyxis marina TaxID=2761622 RepID=A0A842I226_9SPHN|nr:murein L,D-transpeptidase catalytic domain family protein [Parasphingopyxis marina]
MALGMPSIAKATAADRSNLAEPPEELVARAMEAFRRHRDQIIATDVIGIADYAAHSRLPRFYILDPVSGRSQTLLVAHGRGSDPAHSGFVQQFSNRPGSAASSSGAYLAANRYVGSHGESRRLAGLDPQNSNAMDRAIVIHPAWYVGPDIVAQQGKLGRSDGCFAFSESDIGTVLNRLGEGHLIYADKI